MTRTLFVHTGGIGDFLCACPALAAWGRGRAVTLAGHRDRLALAVAAGLAEEALSLDAVDFASLFSTPGARLRGFAARFAEAVVWMGDDDGTIARGLRACGVAEVRCFPGLPGVDWRGHASDYYAERLGVRTPRDWRLNIAPDPAFSGWVIHPGSGSARKNWPGDRFAAAAARLGARGHAVHWCTGPAEEDQTTPEETRPLRREALLDLARCLAAADGYLGNDSGITHLAGAVGCATVAVFGPTDPLVWAPRGRNVTVVRGTPWPGLEAVLGALTP